MEVAVARRWLRDAPAWTACLFRQGGSRPFAVQGGMLGAAVPPLSLALFVAGAKRGAIVYHERA